MENLKKLIYVLYASTKFFKVNSAIYIARYDNKVAYAGCGQNRKR